MSPPVPRPPAGRIESLVELVATLRGPDGCPWDREQTPADLRAYLLEEAHEVAAALDSGDWDALRDEMGDLLFQLVFLASLAATAGAFDLGAAIDAVHGKMVERHPHVFGEATRPADASEVRASWERRKAAEGGARGKRGSLLDGVAASLPALTGAYRMTQKAAGVGFDWPTPEAVVAKLREEIDEIVAARDGDATREEVGDLLFTVVNLARKLAVDPEGALARANLKFRRRFAAIEARLAEAGRSVDSATLEELDRLWEDAKRAEGAVRRTE